MGFPDSLNSVWNLQAYLHPDSEHWLDWFHITMRISVLAAARTNSRRNSRRYYVRQDVADSIHYLAHVGDARPTTSFCWRNE